MQNFGSCISRTRVEQLKFDFIEPNKLELFKRRYRFYDAILSNIFVPKYLSSSYIAGSYFLIKYDNNAPASKANIKKYEKHRDKCKIHIYLKISKRKHFKSVSKLPSEYFNSPYANFEPKYDEDRSTNVYVFEAKLPHRSNLVKVEFTWKTLRETLNEFNFEPCKIGYSYKKEIVLSRWYLNGCQMFERGAEEMEAFRKMAEKHKYMGITSDMNKQIDAVVFYNLKRNS